MNQAEGTGGVVIWRRAVDRAAATQRWNKLARYYGVPMAVALVVALVLGGFGAFLGVLILLGLFGSLLVGMVFLTNHNAAANATIELVDGYLMLGRRRVEIAAVTSWAMTVSGENWDVRGAALGNPMSGSPAMARVLFRAGDDVVAFAWAGMPPEHLQQVRAALQPYIAAPLVSAEQLTNGR
jgi:hypothetical protein